MKFYVNRKVLVTGASSGIGVAFCHHLASYGADLIITARRKDRLEALAKEIRSRYDVEVSVYEADLSDPDSPQSLYRKLQAGGEEVDILINNAGFGFNGRFEEGATEMYQQMMQVNMNSLVLLTRLLLPGMLKRGSGGILNVSSIAGFLPVPLFSIYSATKQFVINFSWSLWWELRGTGVHASVLCPGPVKTEFFDVAGADMDKAAFRGLQSPEEAARRGLAGLAKNQAMKVSRPPFRILYLLSKWIPLKIGLFLGEMSMKK